jgi:hypothetical protein
VVTTIEKFPGIGRDYNTNPTIDVEVLEGPAHCESDGGDIVFDPSAYRWNHAEGFECTAPRLPYPRPKCRFCGTDEAGVVVDKQHAWYDARECTRCGGVSGFAIGD